MRFHHALHNHHIATAQQTGVGTLASNTTNTRSVDKLLAWRSPAPDFSHILVVRPAAVPLYFSHHIHQVRSAMQTHTPRQLAWLWTGAIALLLPAVCFPSVGRCSCGDYVTPHHPTQRATVDKSGKLAPLPLSSHRHLPCTGPHCSSQPER